MASWILRLASRPRKMSRAAAAAVPNTSQVPVLWKPRRKWPGCSARPIRMMVSQPATSRSQPPRAGLTDVLGRRQRGRPHRHARMQHRPDVSVVGIVARAERDVHEGCVLRIERARGEQDVRGALLAHQADVPARPIAPGQPCPDRAYAKVIEQEPTELLPYFGRQRCGVEIGRERGKRLGRLMGCHDGYPRTRRLSPEQARAGKPQLRITWPT